VLNAEGRIVGTGYTAPGGQDHAEWLALQEAGEQARGGTIFVSLEPCNGERRANGALRCSHAILEAGIREVHYALDDPTPQVAGGGLLLAQAGLKVVKGECAEEASQDFAAFFKWISSGLPYVILKYAMTLDGKIATASGDSRWVTGEAARLEVHRLRDESDAILVGVNTIIADNSALTTRLPIIEQAGLGRVARSPLRVVLDSSGRIPLTAQIVSGQLEGQTIVATANSQNFPLEKRQQLEARGIEILALPAKPCGKLDLLALLSELGKRGILQLMVEGGGTVLNSFLQPHPITERPLADKVWAFIAPKLVGGGNNAPGPLSGDGVALMSQAQTLSNVELLHFGQDILLKGDL
jgi:diaminohydroxyphosphoribosylaminopyrimidine deaminase/5-amino-6-(5-phosphoribosylamino)uracil reductase